MIGQVTGDCKKRKKISHLHSSCARKYCIIVTKTVLEKKRWAPNQLIFRAL